MRFQGNARDNPLNWSFPVGRLFGIAIRVHMFFIIGAVIIIAMAFKDSREGEFVPSLMQTLGVLGVVFFSVLCHEFGHCFGARATGGEANEVLLWPLGGLAMVSPPHTPRAHLITVLAGPAVNILFMLIAVAAVQFIPRADAISWNPWHTLGYALSDTDPVARWIGVFFAVNLLQAAFNLLLPIYPLDGGRVLHAVLWPRHGYQRATLTATYVGMVGSIVLALLGLLTAATILLMIAIFGYITCYYDRVQLRADMLEGAGEFGYDFSKGYAAFEEERAPRKPGYFQRRRIAREEARREREIENARRHQEEIDRILAKIRREGMAALTSAERRLLEKETQRQRSSDG